MADRNGNQRNGSTATRLSARDAAVRVREDLPALLGRDVESVLGVQRDDGGDWVVAVSVVELARVPSTTDVLGVYEVTLDSHGELLGYRRRRRYTRNQTDED